MTISDETARLLTAVIIAFAGVISILMSFSIWWLRRFVTSTERFTRVVIEMQAKEPLRNSEISDIKEFVEDIDKRTQDIEKTIVKINTHLKL